MVTDRMSEDTPTDITALRPVSDPTSVVIPKAARVPEGHQPSLAPHPDSYLDQAVFQVLAGMRRLDNVESAVSASLDQAVSRIGTEAAAREEKRAKVVDANLEIISSEVKHLRASLEALSPRVTGTESGIESIRAEMRVLRTEFENKNHEYEQRMALMDQAILDAQNAAFKHLTS